MGKSNGNDIEFSVDIADMIKGTDEFSDLAQSVANSVDQLTSAMCNLDKATKKKIKPQIDTSQIQSAAKAAKQVDSISQTINKLNRNGQVNYYASQEKMIERLTAAYKKYTSAADEAAKKSAGNEIMRWGQAYRGAKYSTKGVDPNIFKIVDSVYKSYEVQKDDGTVSNSMRHYSQETFSELFSAMKSKGTDIKSSDMYWARRNRTVRQIEPVEIDMGDLVQVKDTKLQERMEFLQGELDKLQASIDDKKAEVKHIPQRTIQSYIKAYTELSLYLEDLNKEIPEKFQKNYEWLNNWYNTAAKNKEKGANSEAKETNAFDFKKFQSQGFRSYEKLKRGAEKTVKDIQKGKKSDSAQAGGEAPIAGQSPEEILRITEALGEERDALEGVRKEKEKMQQGNAPKDDTAQQARDNAEALKRETQEREKLNEAMQEKSKRLVWIFTVSLLLTVDMCFMMYI